VDLRLLRRRYASYSWEPVTIGASGAAVFRLSGRGDVDGLFVKALAAGSSEAATRELTGEADRLRWLGECGIAVPDVVEVVADSDVVALVTRALPGISAAEDWPTDQLGAVVDAVADTLRGLHALLVSTCPFDRSLSVTMTAARAALEHDEVDLTDLDPERSGWTGQQLVAELEATRPAVEDLVVSHGDYCLPNIVLDPGTVSVTGLVDLGRTGLADRHCDLALMARSLSSPANPSYGPAMAQRFLRRYAEPGDVDIDIDIDSARLDFYRLLDEFS
jgi:kanamycin kinase